MANLSASNIVGAEVRKQRAKLKVAPLWPKHENSAGRCEQPRSPTDG